jgi:hypothetical protein
VPLPSGLESKYTCTFDVPDGIAGGVTFSIVTGKRCRLLIVNTTSTRNEPLGSVQTMWLLPAAPAIRFAASVPLSDSICVAVGAVEFL